MKYALRQVGTSEFVSKLPYGFENLVPGWTNPAMMAWDSEEDAKWARDGDPDGDSLSVEEVEL